MQTAPEEVIRLHLRGRVSAVHVAWQGAYIARVTDLASTAPILVRHLGMFVDRQLRESRMVLAEVGLRFMRPARLLGPN